MRLIVRIFPAVAVLAASGCVAPRVHTAVPEFVKAVDLTARNTRSAFNLVQQRVDDVETFRLVLEYDKQGFHPGPVHSWIDNKDLQARLTLLKALREYAHQLEALSSDKQFEGVDAAAKGIADSLTTLSQSDTLKNIATKANFDPNAATAAVDALGRWLIERKRNRELPSIIEKMQVPVQTISDLLSRDVTVLRNQLSNSYDELLRDQDKFISESGSRMSAVEKREQITKLPKILHERATADAMMAHTMASLTDLPKANGELLQAVRARQGFGSAIAELADEASQVGDFYNSLVESQSQSSSSE